MCHLLTPANKHWDQDGQENNVSMLHHVGRSGYYEGFFVFILLALTNNETEFCADDFCPQLYRPFELFLCEYKPNQLNNGENMV